MRYETFSQKSHYLCYLTCKKSLSWLVFCHQCKEVSKFGGVIASFLTRYSQEVPGGYIQVVELGLWIVLITAGLFIEKKPIIHVRACKRSTYTHAYIYTHFEMTSCLFSWLLPKLRQAFLYFNSTSWIFPSVFWKWKLFAELHDTQLFGDFQTDNSILSLGRNVSNFCFKGDFCF